MRQRTREQQAAPPVAGALPTAWGARVPWGGVAFALGYMLLWAASGLVPTPVTDLDAFFLPVARMALDGHLLQIYSLRVHTIFPYANGPLSVLPLAALAAVARLLGWLDDPTLRRTVVLAGFALGPLLLGREALLLLERLRPGARVRRWGTLLLFVGCPILWLGMIGYGHIEQPLMLWLVLLGVRLLLAERPAAAGTALGLALLTRSAAVVYVLVLLLVTLWQRRWHAAARLAVAALLAVAVGLLPFYLADPQDTLYSLVTFRALLPIGGGSFWSIGAWQPLLDVGMRYDGTVTLLVVALLTAALLAGRRSLAGDSRDLVALLALAALCLPLFIKSLWPYYFLDPYVFLLLWVLARRPRVPGRAWRWELALPVGMVLAAQVAEYGGTHGTYAPQAAAGWSLVLSLLIVAAGAWVVALLLRAPAAPSLPGGILRRGAPGEASAP